MTTLTWAALIYNYDLSMVTHKEMKTNTIGGAVPRLTHLSSDAWPAAGGLGVTAYGEFFESGCKVLAGGTLVTPTLVSSTELQFTTPALDPDTYNVMVYNPSNQGSVWDYVAATVT
ncbi:MAG: IPT/TIG domain-containing protein [Actinobacteria bacterium]|nr:IPT/TIG domain-containing protein [Actinomycetota bacterium]